LLNAVLAIAARDPATFQCALFLACFATLWVVEQRAFGETPAQKTKHSGVNLLFLVIALPAQLALIALCLRVAAYVTAHRIGLVYLLPHADNVWIRLGVMFLVLDLLDYFYHYLAHNVPFIWRFHLAHHSDQAVDVSTTFREHAVETLIRVSFLTLVVAICGASVAVLALRQTIETFANLSQHTRFRLPQRAQNIFGKIFVTPNLHHAHHHFRLPGTNSNYGDVLSIWDRIFGTYRDFGQERIVFGVDTHMEASDLEIFCEPLGWTERKDVSRLPA
jgi:sterol desaturase/sphingolipid hydroxylase (fatty acid hydroxylase superfamily)